MVELERPRGKGFDELFRQRIFAYAVVNKEDDGVYPTLYGVKLCHLSMSFGEAGPSEEVA